MSDHAVSTPCPRGARPKDTQGDVGPSTTAEREKWDAYYRDQPEDLCSPTTLAFSQSLARLMSKCLPAGASTLEAGCGAGWQSLAMAQAGFEAHLLDFSGEALRHARAVFASAGARGSFMKADAFEPAAECARKFDLVFNAGVLEHYTPDQQADLLRGMASRSSRYVLALVPNPTCYWYWIWRVRTASHGLWPWGAEVPMANLAQAFEAAGLRFLGRAFLGEEWAESFITGLDGLSADLKAQLLEIHRLPICHQAHRSYITAALGTIDAEAATPPGFVLSEFSEDYNIDRARATIADLAAAQIALRADLNKSSSREASAALALEEATKSASDLRGRADAAQAHAASLLDRAESLAVRIAATERQRQELARRLAGEEAARAAAEARLTSEQASQASRAALAVAPVVQELANVRVSRHYKLGHALSAIANRPVHGMAVVAGWALGRYRRRGTGLFGALESPDPIRPLQESLQGFLDARPAPAAAPLTESDAHALLAEVNRVRESRRHKLGNIVAAVKSNPVRGLGVTARWALGQYKPEGRGLASALQATDPLDAVGDRIRRILERPAPEAGRDGSDPLADIIAQHPDVRGIVVYPPVVDWDWMKQRPHHVMTTLARLGYLCFFVSDRTRTDKFHGFKKVEDRLYLCDNLASLYPLESPIVLLSFALLLPQVEKFKKPFIIYDYLDDLSLHDEDPATATKLREQHDRLLRSADLVLVTADRLIEEARKVRPDLIVCPNAVDPAHFRPTERPECPADLGPIVRRGRPIVGYYGALARWVDFDLIEAVSKRRPDLEFVLLGPNYDLTFNKRDWSKIANLHWLGEKKYEELPAYLCRWSVTTIPFKVNSITLGTSPLKMFEYFAGGKPCIATPLPECVKHDTVLIADDAESFSMQLDRALDLGKDEAFLARLAADADANSWTARLAPVVARLETQRQPAAPAPRADPTSIPIVIDHALVRAQDLVAEHTPNPYYKVYRQHERFYWAAAPRWITEARLTPDSRVLDVGCAYGTLAVFTRLAFAAKVHAVDFVDVFAPRGLFERMEIPFAVCNIEVESPPFEPGFDLIIFTEVLEHLNFNPVPTLKRLAGLLNPGGTILLTTPDAAEWGRVTTYFPRLRDMPDPVRRDEYIDGHVWQYRVHELLWVFEQAGLVPVAMEHSPGTAARHFNVLLKRRVEIEPTI